MIGFLSMLETASMSSTICVDGGGDSVDTVTSTPNVFMSVDELATVVEQPAINYASANQEQNLTFYPQQQFLLNYQQAVPPDYVFRPGGGAYAFMSTTADFSHPPPNSATTTATYRPPGGVLVAAPPTLHNFVPLPTTGAYISSATENFADNGAYIPGSDHQFTPYPYPAIPNQPIMYSHYQQQPQPHVVYGQTATAQPHAALYAAKTTQNKNGSVRAQTAFSSSDTGSSLMKASAASDTASSCSGSGTIYRNPAPENHSQTRRYSDPRPSTSRQQPTTNQHDTSSEMGGLVVDSTSNVSKTSTVKSSGVDSVDSADSGLTADHSSPEHRTSTPTTAPTNSAHLHYHHYQAPPPAAPMMPRPQTLPFAGGVRYEAPTAENQQSTSSTTNHTTSTSTIVNNSSGGGLGESRSSSPPPPPSSNGDGGSNAGGSSANAAGVGLGFPPVGPHAVYVHVNLGETLSVRVGNEIQHIPGPATVRMVSSHNAGPPVPLPLHVPPGHVVQQIVDENGTLRHLILSPQTPQPPAATAGAAFPCVNIPNGPIGPSVQFVPVNGNGPAAGVRGGVHGPSPIPGTMAGPPNGVGPMPVTVLASNECPPGPPYHPLHPPPPMMAIAPMAGHHAAHMAASAGIRHPLHLHTNPPHICQLHVNGGSGEDGHIYAAGDRGYGAKMMNRGGGGKQGAVNANHATTGGTGQRAYHNEYQDQENNSPLHDTTMDDNTSAATSGGNEDEEISKIAEMLSRIPPPQVCDIGPRDALVQWQPFDCSEASASGGPFPQIDASEFTYEILLYERRPDGPPTNNYRCQADQLQQQWLANLKPSTEYFVKLRALLEERGLRGEPSPAVAFKTKPTQPDRCQPPRVHQRSKTWLLLRWQQPIDNGAKITGYHLEMDESGASGGDASFKEVYFGTTKQFKLQKLQPSTLYRIRLAASNQHGKSEYSDVLLVQTSGAPPIAPDPPSLLQATSHTLTLHWQRRDGDDEFQLFMEDPQTGHGYLPVASTRDVTYTVQSLMRNKEYRFRLTAVNEDGRSMPSETVAYRTLPARPQAPPKPHAKGRVASNNVKIAWEQPRDTGGGEIVGYQLEMCNEMAGPSSWFAIFEGPDQEFHVNGLEPGVAYRFRVACCSPGGRSAFSEELFLTTSPVPPGLCRPVQLHGKAKATSLHLKWSPPEIRGGAEISEYELIIDVACQQQPSTPAGSVALTPSNEQSSPPPTPPTPSVIRPVYQGPRTDFVVSAGLQPGRTYAFRVRAYNRAGAGPWSDRFECETASAPPDCPQRPRLIGQTSNTATLAWDPPASTNGAPITEYRLHQACRIVSRTEVPLSIGDSDQSTSADKNPLPGENVQQVTTPPSPAKSVRSIAAAVSSAHSTASTSSSSGAATSAPVRQHSTASNASSASTTMTETVSGLDSDYSALTLIHVGNTTTYDVKALKPATDYVFRIQAINTAGFSRLSDALFCRTPAGVPEPPCNVRTEVQSLSEVFVQWDAPLDNGSPIIGYFLDISPPPVINDSSDNLSSSSTNGVALPIDIPANSTQYTVENLLPETSYRFRVQAYNEVGVGPHSTPTKAITFSPPPLPPALELAVASHNSLKLRWNEPSSSSACAQDNAITYTVEMENKSGAFSPVAADLTPRSCKVPRLNESTVYRFRIRACSSTGGYGAWSEIFAFKTLRTPPTAVKSAPRISDVTESSCQIDWQPVKLGSGGSSALAPGEKLHYSLQIHGPSSSSVSSTSSSEDFRTVYKGPSTSYHMNGLAQGCSYRIRVCTVRVSPSDSDSRKETDTYGAPSPTCSFTTISPVVNRKKASDSTSHDVANGETATEGGGLASLIRHPRQLSDSQWAILILVIFSILALLVAVTLQRFIPSAATTTSGSTPADGTYSTNAR